MNRGAAMEARGLFLNLFKLRIGVAIALDRARRASR